MRNKKKIRGRKPSLVSTLISLANRLGDLAGQIDRIRSIYLPASGSKKKRSKR